MADETEPLIPPAVLIARDYSEGTFPTVFSVDMPPVLDGLVDAQTFASTVASVNDYFSHAEALDCGTCCRGCLNFALLYLLDACTSTRYERDMERLGAYLDDQNKTIYNPRGMHWHQYVCPLPLSCPWPVAGVLILSLAVDLCVAENRFKQSH